MPDSACPVASALAAAVAGRAGDRRWVVGLSGGADSTALLLALAERRDAGASLPPLAALHIHHGLHPDADGWARRCAALCAEWGVALQCERVRVAADGRGPEAAARSARYAAFEHCLGAGDVLFLAHHQDDQVETVLLRLLRGAGARGLAGMPAQRAVGEAVLLRPFLELPRVVLRDYLAARSVPWIEDPGNADAGADRNYLRHAVLPRIGERWPGYRDTISRAAANLRHGVSRPAPPPHRNEWGDPGLALAALAGEDAIDVLRAWLLAAGCEPGERAPLAEFLRQLGAAAADGAPRLRGPGWVLGRHGDGVYLLPQPVPFPVPPPRPLKSGEVCDLPGVGRVSAAGGEGGATLAFRSGGERLRLPGARHHRRLKQLLQEARMPPWWRERLPLLLVGGELVAAGERWCAAGSPWRLRWDRSGVPYRAPE